MPDPTTAPKALVLCGPTASGKSALALALAEQLAPELTLEVVSMDSALVYRGMDIGTAKPSLAERAALPHHLIDLIEPTEAYSAARFVTDAQRCVDEIRARGHLPLVVGGTLLYLKALREGLSALPPADAAVRAELDAEAARLGWPALHAELARVDAATAARLAPHDAQRIQRALEVWRLSGRSLSSWHADAPPGHAHAQAATADALWPVVSLEPRDRSVLHARIDQRLRQMWAQGFLAEVQRLRARGDLHAGLPSMRCVGYRQAWQALDEAGPTPDLAALHERALAATRQLAKRQLTWLRSVPSRSCFACDDEQGPTQALQHLREQALAAAAWLPRPCR